MNYYEHHLGDYAKNTMHLSMLEQGAYRLLLDRYYATEKCLPADKKTIQRLVCARSDDEREAVDTVLEEFFVLMEDGWHNARCDRDIEKYREGESEREFREANEKERSRRHREERSRLFSEMRERGVIPKWDIPINDLRELHKRTCNAPVTHLQHTCNAPVTATRNAPVTANQYPIPNTQTPGEKRASESEPESRETDAAARAPPKPEKIDEMPPPTTAGAICCAIRSHGIAAVSPSHPELAKLIAAGAGVGEFDDVAIEAAAKGKGFAWILGTVAGRRRDAAMNANGIRGSPATNLSKAQRNEQWCKRLDEVLQNG